MAKRKSSMSSKMAQRKKPVPKLDTTFCCPFCDHPDSVACTIGLKLLVATAVYYVYEEAYHTTAHHLTEPVDVYHDWIDVCEKANQGVQLQAPDYQKRDTYSTTSVFPFLH
ncbi:transcription elongation factor 1 homolog [Aegilops tauschii subsp. strangulata]|uniref:Transcription elongation factor 1 homolog n=1 Tax=Aegilops tauschii TaxID=37682 RepID=M8AXE4_AEGTA|nr:transcription elongation factor 1 homolog [Aegilops tauschii subsp. strangulata]